MLFLNFMDSYQKAQRRRLRYVFQGVREHPGLARQCRGSGLARVLSDCTFDQRETGQRTRVPREFFGFDLNCCSKREAKMVEDVCWDIRTWERNVGPGL